MREGIDNLKPYKILFRADLSPLSGMGHFTRCLNLALEFDSLTRLDVEISFLLSDIHSDAISLLNQSGFKIIFLEFEPGANLESYEAQEILALNKVLINKHFDWVILDHYKLSALWESEIKKNFSDYVLVFEDLTNRIHNCDVLVNTSLTVMPEQLAESCKNRSTQLLLGPKFVPLGREYRNNGLRPNAPRVAFSLRESVNIFINFGGSTSREQLNRIIECLAVERPEFDYIRVKAVSPNSLDVACDHRMTGVIPRFDMTIFGRLRSLRSMYEWADIVIGAGGISSWERCACGVPTAAVAIANNQLDNLVSLNKVGALLYLGDFEDVRDNWRNFVRFSVGDWVEMGRISSKLVDGAGGPRIVDTMLNYGY